MIHGPRSQRPASGRQCLSWRHTHGPVAWDGGGWGGPVCCGQLALERGLCRATFSSVAVRGLPTAVEAAPEPSLSGLPGEDGLGGFCPQQGLRAVMTATMAGCTRAHGRSHVCLQTPGTGDPPGTVVCRGGPKSRADDGIDGSEAETRSARQVSWTRVPTPSLLSEPHGCPLGADGPRVCV